MEDALLALCEAVEFSPAIKVDTRRGPRMVRRAPATDEFWQVWREWRRELTDAGVSAAQYRGKWEVTLWSDEHFHFVELPQLPDEPVIVTINDLVPLNFERGILDWQKIIVQYCVAGLRRNGSFLLGLPTGMGKTYITLAAARELGLGVVTTCPKTITRDWQRAADYLGVECEAYGWEHMKLEKTEHGGWDGLNWQWKLPKGKMLSIDEIHRARNRGTDNCKLVHAAGRQKDDGLLSAGLSATAGESPVHLDAIGRWLGLHRGGVDFFRWAGEYGVQKSNDKLFFPKNDKMLRKLHREIFPRRGVRLRWSDLGDAAPVQKISCEPVDFGKEVREVYQELEAQIKEIATIQDKAERRGSVLAARTAARRKIELIKAPYVVDMTKALLEESNSVFIAVNYTETLKFLLGKIKGSVAIYGGQSDQKRRGAIDAFQRDSVRVIIGIIQACREGISLHDLHGNFPRHSLIMPCDSAFDLKQVLGRTPRAGALSPAFQRMLYAANSIEENICYSLQDKLDNMSLLNDGELDPVTHVCPA